MTSDAEKAARAKKMMYVIDARCDYCRGGIHVNGPVVNIVIPKVGLNNEVDQVCLCKKCLRRALEMEGE